MDINQIDSARARTSALRGYGILDTPNEPGFDTLVRLAAQTLGTAMALISFVDEDRQWFKARIGINLAETPLTISFCTHAIRGRGVFAVCDASADDLFRENPLVTGAPFVRFYAGAPLTAGTGVRIGTLCVLDERPRSHLSETNRDELAQLAERVMAMMETRRHRLRQMGAQTSTTPTTVVNSISRLDRRKHVDRSAIER